MLVDLRYKLCTGMGKEPLLPGIKPISPLDVLDIVLMHRKEGAFILDLDCKTCSKK